MQALLELRTKDSSSHCQGICPGTLCPYGISSDGTDCVGFQQPVSFEYEIIIGEMQIHIYVSKNVHHVKTGLIPGLRPAYERRLYKVTLSLIGLPQT